MPTDDPIFCVDLEDDEGLRLRAQPSSSAETLVALAPGQLVARLDEDDRDGWRYVFADTPGDGAYVGYVQARMLRPWTSSGTAQPPPPDAASPRVDARTPGATAWPDPPGKVAAPGWNPMVPAERRYGSRKFDERNGRVVNRVIIHVTGGAQFQSVHDTFMNVNAPHYLVDKQGLIHQYVQEKDRGQHAAMPDYEKSIYDRGDGSWRRYRRIVPGVRLPQDTVFVKADGVTPAPAGSAEAKLAMRPAGSVWPLYAAFDERWGALRHPIGYNDHKEQNEKSIGIEILSIGHRDPLPEHYTEAMYQSLGRLVTDICRRYELPQAKGVVVGHEDVNPIARGMWDPNSGFDWSRVWAATP